MHVDRIIEKKTERNSISCHVLKCDIQIDDTTYDKIYKPNIFIIDNFDIVNFSWGEEE